jgi:hypothetical protein
MENLYYGNQEQVRHENERPYDKYRAHSEEENSVTASYSGRQEKAHIKLRTNNNITRE